MKSEIYQPAEDSYLLQDTLEKYLRELIINNKNKQLIKQKIKRETAAKQSSINNSSSNFINNILNNKSKPINSKTSYQQKPYIKFHKINNKNKIYKSNIKKIKILEMGTGTGIQALTCKKLGFNNILAADINQEAVKLLKKQGFKSKHSDLFSKINKKNKFQLIIFNPPYLPEDKYDKKPDTTAGKQGYELIIKFLKQAKTHLTEKGVILLLFSSFSKPSIIIKEAKKLGYEIKLLNKQKLFFEELFVYKLS